MSLLSWLGRAIRLTDVDFWTAWYGTESWSGETVSDQLAMQLSAYWANVRLQSQTIGSLPCGMYRNDANGHPSPAPDHPLHRLVHDQPNAEATAMEFWEGVTAWLITRGNAYAEKMPFGGRIVGMELLDATRVSYEREERTGRRKYEYADPITGRRREIPEERMFHVRGFGFGGDLGLSVIAYARQSLGTAIAAERAAATTFANGLNPSGFFQVDQVLKPEQREQLKKVLIDPLTGTANRRKVGILEAGMKWQSVTLPPEDAELLSSRKLSVEDICRWFNTPPILIGHASEGQTMWGTGVEQIMLGFVKLGLTPLLKRIEAAFSRDMIAPAERDRVFMRFNMEGLLRGDSVARATFLKEMTLNGIYTHNEARAYENKPPMPGGDVLTVQSQLVPLDQIGKVPPAPAAGGAR